MARLPPAQDLVSRTLPEPIQPYQEGGRGGAVLSGIGDRINQLVTSIERETTRRAEAAAIDAGTAAGEANPGSQMEGGGANYQAAFNRAAAESSRRRLEISARSEFDRLAREHDANPAAFTAAVAQYREEVLGSLPETMRPRVAPGLDAMARPYLHGITKHQDRAVADERVATFQRVYDDRLGAIERSGLRGDDPAARADAAREMASIERDLIALGPRHAFTYMGREYPADPTRAGALTLTQISERVNQARDTELMGVARGQFQRGPRTEEWVAQFERRGEAGELPGIRPEMARTMASRFRSEIARDRSALNESQRQARVELTPIIERNRVAILETGAPVEVIDNSRLVAAGIDPARHRAAETAQMEGWQARSDLNTMTNPAAAQEVADRFMPGGALFNADPQNARQVLELARSRGAQIRASALEFSAADRVAQTTAGIARATRVASSVPADWVPHIQRAAQDNGLPEFLLRAQIGQESGGRAGAVSRAGASGPAQIMPGTAANPGFGLPPLPADAINDPARAIPWAARLLGRLREHYNGNLEHALAAYNWGPGNVDRWVREGARPEALPAETRQYLAVLMPAAGIAGVSGPGGDPTAPPGSPARMPGVITPEEARAAGHTPEWLAQANARAEEQIRTASLRAQVLVATPADRPGIEAQLAQIGERAAENARLSQVYAETLQERQRAIREDPAGFVASISPTLQNLQQRVGQGEMEALPQLMEGLRFEQERQGIPPADRTALPRPIAEGIAASIAMAPDAQTALQRLAAVRQAVGEGRLPDALAGLRLDGAIPAERRQAVLAAASISRDSPQTAEQIMRGVYALRDNPVAALTPARMQPVADTVLGNAFQDMPQARDMAVAAARAVYAAEALAEGRMGQPFDASRFRSALERVMPMTSYNGHPTPLPPRMQPAAFSRLMDSLPAEALEGARASDGRPFTPAMAAQGGTRLVPIGPGQYRLNYGAFQVLDPQGRVFVLNLNDRAPVVPVRPNAGQRGGAAARARAAAGATGYDPAAMAEDP
jgi:soluble lytic murein transglycosylase-like protein